VFQRNLFNGISSKSGQGSSVAQTQEIARLLPQLIRELHILSFLDIPCGDLEWMSKVDLDGIEYFGSDVSPSLIQYLKTTYPDKQFREINICKDSLPQVDLIFCRDLFVHLSYKDIRRALQNIRKSGSSYLATTTFTSRSENRDLPIFTRGIAWRTLNLEISPFNLPAPKYLHEEKCTEGNGLYSDKAIGIWKISDI
jgi:hypothetical protein